MELRHLRYFLAVADAMSFTAAAEKLRIAQPALSQQIRALERELGVTLIERGARTRALTEAGARFAARARRILLEAETASEEMAGLGSGRRGTVRFGSALQSLTEGRVAGLLAGFHRANPGLRVAFREAHTRPLLSELAHGRLDLALVHLGEETGGGDLRIEFEDFPVEIERLYEEPLLLAVGPAHRLARRRSVRWSDLGREEFVSFGPGSTVRELAGRAARAAGIALRAPISAINLGTIRALVSAGLGVAVLPRAAFALPGAPLQAVRLTDPSLTRVVSLARNTIRYERPASRRFADFLRAGLQGSPRGERHGA
ncbi:MAG TPA: LysR family transcriptional regulator [Thermoanaerobaculia bacterium]|jgi:DNA-binding transcriptional LysR family regulator|nr:LysR family transcriptional regulator [Thermoanaerobaculia bacterium]